MLMTLLGILGTLLPFALAVLQRIHDERNDKGVTKNEEAIGSGDATSIARRLHELHAKANRATGFQTVNRNTPRVL
jgi:hypothetical protein